MVEGNFLAFELASIFKKNNMLIWQAIKMRTMAHYLHSVGSTIKTVILTDGPRGWFKDKLRFAQHG